MRAWAKLFWGLAAVLAVCALAPDSHAVESPAAESRELQCLALNIYWEAGTESRRGKLAVAHVTLNRVQDGGFPDSVCGVVKQGGEKPRHGCQFHWWCDGRSDVPDDASRWEESLEAARAALKGEAADPTAGALFFHNTSVRPAWQSEHSLTARIGNHLFYR